MHPRVCLAVILLVVGGELSAQTISPTEIGLYNTGIRVRHRSPYTLFDSPDITGTTYRIYEPDSRAWPIDGPWVDNVDTGANAVQWLAVYSGNRAPRGDSDVPTVAAGDYTFRLNFDLRGYDSATVGFTIHAAADNRLAVMLNDRILPNYGTASGDVNYSSLASYAYTVAGTASGLHNGPNYLDFVVTNAAGGTGNPAGLYVTFSDFTTAVPEPSTYALLLGVSTGALVLWRRRRRQRRVF